MGVGIQIKGDALILSINQRHLQRRMLRRDGIALEKQRNGWIVDPCAQNCLERKASAAKIISEILFLHRMCSFESDLVPLVTGVKLRNVAFLCNLNALLVGELREAAEKHTVARGPAVVKAVAASLLFPIAYVEISRPAQRLNCLIKKRLCFAGVFLIERDRNRGRRLLCAGSWRRSLRLSP